MDKYVVVKTFDVLEKGDVFTRNNDGTFSCEMSESFDGCNYKSKITVSNGYMKKAMFNGDIELRAEETETPSVDYKDLYKSYNEKFVELSNYITRVRKSYQEDIEYTTNQWKNGMIQECQKVQDVTVLSNLIKELDVIETKLNA